LLAVFSSPLFAGKEDKIIAQRVSKPPTLDGTISPAEWAGAISIDVDPKSGVWDFGKTEVKYTFYVMYDETYLYVAASLTDDDIQIDTAPKGSQNGETWKDDSIEIFVDGDHSHSVPAFTAVEYATGGQYVITANNAVRFQNSGAKSFGPGKDDDYYAVAAIHGDNNWEMEARLRLGMFGSPKEGDTVGFNISTNDDDGGGDEEAALFWTGELGVDIYNNESVWGDLTFGPPYSVNSLGKLIITWSRIKSDF